MNLNPEIRRRSFLPFLALILALIYLFVFQPFESRIEKLDVQLDRTWRRLATVMGQTNATRLDFVGLTNQFEANASALNSLENAREQARARTKWGEDLRNHLTKPFQLVDYEAAMSRRKGELIQAAQEKKVVLEPGVINGFPGIAAAGEPSLAWAELAVLDSVLTVAIRSQVTAIHSVMALRPVTHSDSRTGVTAMTELPMRIELTGPAQNVGRFLQALPLRADEIKAAGLPEGPEFKPALFIDRMILKKQSREKADEIRVSLQVVGFVIPE